MVWPRFLCAFPQLPGQCCLAYGCRQNTATIGKACTMRPACFLLLAAQGRPRNAVGIESGHVDPPPQAETLFLFKPQLSSGLSSGCVGQPHIPPQSQRNIPVHAYWRLLRSNSLSEYALRPQTGCEAMRISVIIIAKGFSVYCSHVG